MNNDYNNPYTNNGANPPENANYPPQQMQEPQQQTPPVGQSYTQPQQQTPPAVNFYVQQQPYPYGPYPYAQPMQQPYTPPLAYPGGEAYGPANKSTSGTVLAVVLAMAGLALFFSIDSQKPSFLYLLAIIIACVCFTNYKNASLFGRYRTRDASIFPNIDASNYDKTIWLFTVPTTLMYVIAPGDNSYAKFIIYTLVVLAAFILGRQRIEDMLPTIISGVAIVVISFIPIFAPFQKLSQLNAFILPILLLIYLQYCSGGKNNMLRRCFYGASFGLFSSLDRAILKNGNNNDTQISDMKPKNSTFSRVIIASLVSIILLAVIVPLLLNSDDMFAYYFTEFFKFINLADVALYLFLIPPTLITIYSAFWNIKNQNYVINPENKEKKEVWDNIISIIVLSVILIVYLLYIVIQFKFIFAGASSDLPNGMIYSEYARKGFFELCFIVATNIGLAVLCNTFTKPSRLTKTLLHALLAASVIMLVSAFLRLRLYIGVFGLTWLRILALWFMILILAAIVLTIIKTEVKSFSFFKLMFIITTVWYLTLNIINPRAIILQFNSLYGYDIEFDDVREAHGAPDIYYLATINQG